MLSKIKPIPRDQRNVKRERMFSTNYPDHISNSGIKCWVPWTDFLSLKIRYEKLVKRRRRELERSTTTLSLQMIIDYIDEGDPDLQVIKAELGELILRAKNQYGLGG